MRELAVAAPYPRASAWVDRVAVAGGVDDAVEPPDFLVLSDAYYARYLRRRGTRPVLERLLAGELGYEPVVTFQQPHLPATALIPSVNPRIVILGRRPAAG